MLTFIIVNSIIVLSAYFLSCSLEYKRKTADFIIIWSGLYFAQIVIVDLILGIFSLLYLHNIIFAHITICLASLILFNRISKPKKISLDLSFILDSKILILAISVFFGFFIVKLWINLNTPSNFPDGWQYHLSFPATWIRNASINNPLVACGPKDNPINFIALTYFPMSSEFYFHWLMAPLRNALLADAGQVPFYLLGVLAIYSILRKFSVSKQRALLLGFVCVLIPNIFKQINKGAEVDVICSALALFVLNMILIIKEEKSLKNFVVLGILVGLFVSTKALDIFWFLSFLPLFFYDFFIKKTPHRIKAAFLVIFFAIILGGYSYIKNFILTGNIFYPVTLKLFGKIFMPGIVDRQVYANSLFPIKEFKLTKFLFSEGLGLQLFTFIIPAVLCIPLIYVLFKRDDFKKEEASRLTFLFAIPIIMTLEYFSI